MTISTTESPTKKRRLISGRLLIKSYYQFNAFCEPDDELKMEYMP